MEIIINLYTECSTIVDEFIYSCIKVLKLKQSQLNMVLSMKFLKKLLRNQIISFESLNDVKFL